MLNAMGLVADAMRQAGSKLMQNDAQGLLCDDKKRVGFGPASRLSRKGLDLNNGTRLYWAA